MSQPQYRAPKVERQWADSRETHIAVATAIHAIADNKRTPEMIWEDATPAECDHIKMAMQNYIEAGVFVAEDDDAYQWGAETISLNA